MQKLSTYNAGFDRGSKANDATYGHENGWYNAHGNECKFPLDSECYDVCREEKGDALGETVQLLSNTLIDTVAVWRAVSASQSLGQWMIAHSS